MRIAKIYIARIYPALIKSHKLYYCDYYIIVQIVKASNPPQNIDSYELQDTVVEMVRPKYYSKTGQFFGLYETANWYSVSQR